ncbi:response regulator [Sediminibacterium soli]|uniref:response regulator n=1 Tax=Sediminibacterium soli TaxID=2698829 RepID=UPI00192A46B5|nr:response regulator transcription factor [Sediminibacterium soli]
MEDQEKKWRILVMDDEVSMQTILRRFLGKFYQVHVCSHGLEAMSYLQDGNIPDAIISDLNTPPMGGLELLTQIKASDFFNSIPVIVLSADERSEMRIKCLEAGADDYVVKPFNPRELAARLAVVLRRVGKGNDDE